MSHPRLRAASVTKFLRGLVLVGACAVFSGAPAYATDQIDLSTGLKTILLLSNRPESPVPVAVVYDPANPESRADAESIKHDIDTSVGAIDDIKFSAQTISCAEFPKISASFKVAFLAKSMQAACIDSIGSAAASGNVLTMSADTDCVKANKCVLGIVTKPRVRIFYSPIAAEANHISFAPAFILLAKQI